MNIAQKNDKRRQMLERVKKTPTYEGLPINDLCFIFSPQLSSMETIHQTSERYLDLLEDVLDKKPQSKKLQKIFNDVDSVLPLFMDFFFEASQKNIEVQESFAKEFLRICSRLAEFNGNNFVETVFEKLWMCSGRLEINSNHISASIKLGPDFADPLINKCKEFGLGRQNIWKSQMQSSGLKGPIDTICSELSAGTSPDRFKKIFDYFEMGDIANSYSWETAVIAIATPFVISNSWPLIPAEKSHFLDKIFTTIKPFAVFKSWNELEKFAVGEGKQVFNKPQLSVNGGSEFVWRSGDFCVGDMLAFSKMSQDFLNLKTDAPVDFYPVKCFLMEIEFVKSLRRINGLDDLENSNQFISPAGIEFLEKNLETLWMGSGGPAGAALARDFLSWNEAQMLMKEPNKEPAKRNPFKI